MKRSKATVVQQTYDPQWMLTEAKHGRSVQHFFAARADARDRAKTSRAQGYATKIVPVLVETRVTVLPGRN